MSTTAIRQFQGDTFGVLNEDGEAHLVAFDENAVYGVELAFPESDDDRYRVDALRLTRDAHGAELQQRLTLAEYPSHMEAEEHLAETSTALFEGGRDALPIAAIREQPAEYVAGYMVASYPPDAVLTGESASVSVIAVSEHRVQDALVGWNLSPWEASHLAMVLEDAQADANAGAAALLQTAAEEARTHGMIQEHQPLFPTSPYSPLAYLDQRDELAYQAEIVQPEPEAWGWHETRFAVLPDGEKHQVALLDVYRDALTGDLAGGYLPLSQHPIASEAEQARDGLIERAFDMEARQVAEGVVENPVWQPMQPAHYDLYERLAGFAHEPDLPPDTALDPLL
ncbi:MAG: hypothetical protein K8I82_30240, partial [Anaerolineae bacterium]|nr:hypothetical protein [Anaerolineae bacterium]